jgi:hypothetical protein
MKKLMLVLLLLLASLPARADLTLAWDSITNIPNITYKLYASTNSFTNSTEAIVTANVGTNTTVTLYGLTNIWYFRAAAFNTNVASDLSSTLIVQIPPIPLNFRTVVIMGGPTVTNFQDLGFFKIRIQ